VHLEEETHPSVVCSSSKKGKKVWLSLVKGGRATEKRKEKKLKITSRAGVVCRKKEKKEKRSPTSAIMPFDLPGERRGKGVV